MIEIDITNLSKSQSSLLFGYNQTRLFSIFDCDYLDNSSESILIKCKRLIDSHLKNVSISNIKLMTIPRVLSKVFRPVSFFCCYDAKNQLVAMIAEVTNTYKEVHLYVMPALQSKDNVTHFKTQKEFHVSPFYDEEGSYHFSFFHHPNQRHIDINYYVGSTLTLHANFKGITMPLNSSSLFWTLLKFPITTFLTLPRIVFQAAKLYYIKKLPAKEKPTPMSNMTIKAMPITFFQNLVKKQFIRFFSDLQHGSITVHFSSNEKVVLGDASSGIHCDLTVYNNKFFNLIASTGEIGMGESYFKGYWGTSNLINFMSLIILNRDYLLDSFRGKWWKNGLNLIQMLLRRNNIIRSKKNIQFHYDLGNDFYSLFLDQTKMYSCAFFNTPTTSLYDAQIEKINKIIEKAVVKQNHHVLEIGTGWGRVAVELAKRTGCRVTSLTLSQKQFDFATRLVKEAGLESLITIKLCDYRNINGKFDRIVSIEMLEAVGHRFLKTYFKKLDSLLTPQGIAVIQVITFPDHLYRYYCKNSDFIRKYIFPGGHLPSLHAITSVLSNSTSLVIQDLENIGLHYAKTLNIWADNFKQQHDEVIKLGFDDEFYRKWVYYLNYCEAAFKTRFLSNLQLVISRVCNSDLQLINESKPYAISV